MFYPLSEILQCPCYHLRLIVRGCAIEHSQPPVTHTVLKENDAVTVVKLQLPDPVDSDGCSHEEESESESPGETAQEDWAMEITSNLSDDSIDSSIWVPPPECCIR